VSQALDLRLEHAVRVDHALGRPGAARGEQDRGLVAARDASGSQLPVWPRTSSSSGTLRGNQRAPTVTAICIEDSARECKRRRTCARARPTKARGSMRARARHERARTHAGIEQHGHGAQLEQREDERDQVAARPHEDRRPVAASQALRARPTASALARASSWAKLVCSQVVRPARTPARRAAATRRPLLARRRAEVRGDVVRAEALLDGGAVASRAARVSLIARPSAPQAAVRALQEPRTCAAPPAGASSST
jgi:hypothetical protein